MEKKKKFRRQTSCGGRYKLGGWEKGKTEKSKHIAHNVQTGFERGGVPCGKYPIALKNDKDISGGAFRTWCDFFETCDDRRFVDGAIHTSYAEEKEIARRRGITNVTVCRHIKKLEKEGWLSVQHLPSGKIVTTLFTRCRKRRNSKDTGENRI